MTVPIIYLTRATLALAEDTAMLFVGSPAGPMEQGAVTSVETARLVFSHKVLRELTAIMNQHVAALDQRDAQARIAHGGDTPKAIADRIDPVDAPLSTAARLQ